MKAWIEALRLRTLPLSAAGVIVAAGLAAYWGISDVSVFIPMLIMVLLLQVLANFADEYGDLEKGVDNDDRVGPRRGMQRGEITKAQMKYAMVVDSALIAISIVWLLIVSFRGSGDVGGFITFLLLGALCIAAAIKYTVGRGAYGYIGLGDLITFLTFGLVAVVGGFFLYSHAMMGIVFLPATGLGCLVVGVLNLNNMRDLDNDRSCGKKTVAVALGRRGAVAYHAMLICVGVAGFITFPLICGVSEWQRYLFVVFCALLLVQLGRTFQVDDPADYDHLMKPLSMTTAFLALSFALCMGL